MRIRPSAYHGSSSSSLDFFSCLLAVETFEKKKAKRKVHHIFLFPVFCWPKRKTVFFFSGNGRHLQNWIVSGLTELYNGGGGQIERIIHLGKSFDPSDKTLESELFFWEKIVSLKMINLMMMMMIILEPWIFWKQKKNNIWVSQNIHHKVHQ